MPPKKEIKNIKEKAFLGPSFLYKIPLSKTAINSEICGVIEFVLKSPSSFPMLNPQKK